MAGPAPLVFIIAGEPSGDMLGARLMVALKQETGGRIRFEGVGGPLMEAQGLASRFDIGELALMGLVEVVRHVPRILRRIRETEAAVRAARPDLLVTIDAPGFTLRVSRRLAGAGIPLVHYVAPSVWAWKPKRAQRIARYLDHLLALLPFEPPYFERHGLRTTFVGHPVVEGAAEPTDPAGFRAMLGIAPGQPLLAVLPGSRRSEVERLGPMFGAALGMLQQRLPGLAAVVPTVRNVAALVRAQVATWPGRATVVEGEQQRRDAFAASCGAIAASGTVVLELAVAGVPAVVAYRVNALTAAIARRLLKIRWASLTSLVLDRQVQPELLQEACTPEAIVAALLPLLEEGGERRRVIDDGLATARLLGFGGEAPSAKAARTLIALLPAGTASAGGP